MACANEPPVFLSLKTARKETKNQLLKQLK